jgi:hypothetical protein
MAAGGAALAGGFANAVQKKRPEQDGFFSLNAASCCAARRFLHIFQPEGIA